jgi:hypothetical protein
LIRCASRRFLRPSGAGLLKHDPLPRVALRPPRGGLRSTRGYIPSPPRGEELRCQEVRQDARHGDARPGSRRTGPSVLLAPAHLQAWAKRACDERHVLANQARQDPTARPARARRPIKPSQTAATGDQAAARPPGTRTDRQSKFGTFFLTYPLVRSMLGTRPGVRRPARANARPGRKGGTFAPCSEPRQVWSGPRWLPGHLEASLPHCLVASLPHCLIASLPGGLVAFSKERTRIEPNFPPWRYRKRGFAPKNEPNQTRSGSWPCPGNASSRRGNALVVRPGSALR